MRSEKLKAPSLFEKFILVIYLLFLLLPVLSIFFRATDFKSVRLSSVCLTAATGILSSVLGTVLALGIAMDLDRKNSVFKDVFSMLPMAVSSVVLGLSYFIISRYLKVIPKSILIVPVHAMIVMPFALRTILPALRSLPANFREEALLEGTNDRTYCLKILFPLLKSPVISSLMYGFAISCGELNSTLLLSDGSIETLPILIQRQIGSYNFGGACATGAILVFLCLAFYIASNSVNTET